MSQLAKLTPRFPSLLPQNEGVRLNQKVPVVHIAKRYDGNRNSSFGAAFVSEDEYDKIVATADVLDEVTALRLGLEYEGERGRGLGENNLAADRLHGPWIKFDFKSLILFWMNLKPSSYAWFYTSHFTGSF
eukprot:sb/3475114/